MKNIKNTRKKFKIIILICLLMLGLLSIVYADKLLDDVINPVLDNINSVIVGKSDTNIKTATNENNIDALPSIIKGANRLEDIIPTGLASFSPKEISIPAANFEPKVMVPMPVTNDYISINLGDAEYRCRVYDAKFYDVESKAKQFVVFVGKINPTGVNNGNGLKEFKSLLAPENTNYKYLSFSGNLDKATGNYVIPISDCDTEAINKYGYLAYPVIVVDENYNKEVDGEIKIPDELKPHIVVIRPKDDGKQTEPDTPLPKNGGSIYHKAIDPNTYWTD